MLQRSSASFGVRAHVPPDRQPDSLPDTAFLSRGSRFFLLPLPLVGCRVVLPPLPLGEGWGEGATSSSLEGLRAQPPTPPLLLLPLSPRERVGVRGRRLRRLRA